ncbi:protein RUFY3 isoform X3 [Silurus asotus]|uniref:Protein RUFY3 isoform X3 n=1 Tax=Silurus asotus TaxID=30991 RepID=A0AAD5ABN7_SILAS|nr:protein RUFY3 isoform X3 [Silurus asotus]
MSDLTPQSEAPTPTTDKITQAARETIYLCNFRVSVDGEWLCLRELNDISLTPEPEPAHEDPKDPIAIERLNLMNMAKLSIKGLIESALNLGRTLDSDYAPLQQFFVVMEHCLKHGLKSKKTFLGQNKSFWGPLELVEKLTPEAGEITASVKDLPGLKTPLGRGRAWLRLALMQKKLSDYMKTIINRKDLLSEFYEPNALMMEEEGAVIAGLLVGLNVIDANLCMKGEDLDSQLAVANNRIITLQEEVERMKEESSYLVESNRKALRPDGAADGQVLGETRKQLKEETQLRLDVEKELEVQIGMRQEMELSMKMLEKDICEKHDALVELRHQLDDLRRINHELCHKSQSSETSLKQKNEIISRFDEKTNQMAATIKQLEHRSKQAEKQRDLAEEANRLFKQEFGDKIASLQQEVEHLQKQSHIFKGICVFGVQERFGAGAEEGARKERGRRGSQHSDTVLVKTPPHRDMQQQVEDIRKQECKNCREVYCKNCMLNEIPLPSSITPERVCDVCYSELLQQYASTPS